MIMINLTIFLFITLLCFTTLTSSVGVVARPDGITTASSLSRQKFLVKPSSQMVKHPTIDAADDKKISKNLASESIIMEGGPVSISTSTQRATLTTATGFDNFRVDKIPKERNAASSVVARKGVEQNKVKGRKGVNETNLDPRQSALSFSQTTLRNTKFTEESTSAMVAIRVNDQYGTSSVTNSILNTTNSQFNDSLEHGVNSSLTLIPINVTSLRTEIANNTTVQNATLHIKKHIPKPKPTVTTIDRSEMNESRLPFQTKSLSLGVPKKLDYIVPIIITIIALPLLGTAIFVLYTRGRDCWDKRHYRRMDFLIDGMYND